MKNQFVPYSLALNLKEFGFDEDCLAGYIFMKGSNSWELAFYKDRVINFNKTSNIYVSAPLWQQAFDWFREKHGIYTTIGPYDSDYTRFSITVYSSKKGHIISWASFIYNSYKQARDACLEKMIELIQNETT